MIPAGEHILTLLAVDEVESNVYGSDDELQLQWLWKFQSDQKDDTGQAFRYHAYTKFSYGNAKANLTKLLDLLIPGMNKGMLASVGDPSKLIGRSWTCHIKHVKNEKGDPKPEIALATPIKGKKGVAQTVAEAENLTPTAPDPFGDEA
jgi:hypothetical protein